MTAAPRHSRRGILIPFLIVGVLLAAWTGWWFYLTRQIEVRLAAQVETLRQDGWDIRHGPVTTTGWPFRARVEVPLFSAMSPAGHGVDAIELVAEANAYNPDKWVVIAPRGLTLARAGKGKVAITGGGARFSISHLRDRFPDVRAELIRPIFTPHQGAEPFPLASAERVEFYSRPHLTDGEQSTDQMDVLFVLTDGRGRPGGPVAGAAQQGELSLRLEAVIGQASRLSAGQDAGVFADWTRAGGDFTGVLGELKAGETRAMLRSDRLYARPDGRIEGQLTVAAEKPLAAIAGLAGSTTGAVNQAGAAAATVPSGERPLDLTIGFEGGRTWLGPFALAPAPKLF